MILSLKSEQQIQIMHEANKIVLAILDYAEQNIKIGISTLELDKLLEDKLKDFDGAISAFKGYKGYPNVSCISINEEVVHGIPGSRIIKDGDIVSVDFGVYYKGLAGDAAKTFMVGNVSDEVQDLVRRTRIALNEGIEAMRPGNHLHDISQAIESIANANNFGNLKEYCGHGVGLAMHEPPHVFNYLNSEQTNVRLRAGMVLALEPMFIKSINNNTYIKEDGWTVVASSLMPAAHWELSVAITDSGPLILGV